MFSVQKIGDVSMLLLFSNFPCLKSARCLHCTQETWGRHLTQLVLINHLYYYCGNYSCARLWAGRARRICSPDSLSPQLLLSWSWVVVGCAWCGSLVRWGWTLLVIWNHQQIQQVCLFALSKASEIRSVFLV